MYNSVTPVFKQFSRTRGNMEKNGETEEDLTNYHTTNKQCEKLAGALEREI